MKAYADFLVEVFNYRAVRPDDEKQSTRHNRKNRWSGSVNEKMFLDVLPAESVGGQEETQGGHCLVPTADRYSYSFRNIAYLRSAVFRKEYLRDISESIIGKLVPQTDCAMMCLSCVSW